MRGASWAALLLATIWLVACARVHVTIETDIGADGSVTRKESLLRVSGPDLKETYRLPTGPGWKVAMESVSVEGLTSEERSALGSLPSPLAGLFQGSKAELAPPAAKPYERYTASRTYRPGEPPAADYVKPHPDVPGLEATNSISVERLPGLLGTTFRYRETFSEASEPDALVSLLRQAARIDVVRQVEAVSKARPRAAPWESFKAGELEASERMLEEVISAWRSIEDEESKKAAEESFSRLSRWMEALPERLAEASGLSKEEVEALTDDPEWEKQQKELSDSLSLYAGAHLGEGDFSFTLIVRMPGVVLRTNAGELRGRSTAVCRFTAEYFLMRPYTCEAESWAPTAF